MDQGYEFLYKILLIGDSGSGKTSILNRFIDKSFNEKYIPTVGIDFRTKIIEQDGKKIKLQIWDIAGQTRFKSVTSSFYRGAVGIVIVYDVTDKKSFENVAHWLNEIDRYSNKDSVNILLGNKNDLIENKKVNYSDANIFSVNNNLAFFETSAKNGDNIDDCFEELINLIQNKIVKIEENNIIKLQKNVKNVKNKNSCCF